MVKRQLDKQEREICEKSLKTRKEEYSTLVSELAYSKDMISRHNFNRDFDDRWRDILRNKVDKENDKAIKDIEFAIEQTNQVIKQVEDELKNGVDIKSYV